jgi:formiminoglutamate deiminase
VTTATWFAEHALLPDGPARDVRFEIADGRFTAITPNAAAAGAHRLPGIVIPGLVNAHSHAFHRALRGRTHDGGGTFWTWRKRMYAVAERLDPTSYLDLARATYAEMALAGITTVAEFHYLHHGPGGTPYADPNAMAEALRQAAVEAGIRLTLLDACYLAGGLDAAGHAPLTGTQLRFGDRDAERWASRVAELSPSEGMRVGAAVHSVRAVPRADVPTVVAAAAGGPLHFHLSEQVGENEACLGYYGCTPTELLGESDALGASSTAIHATHLSPGDVTGLGASHTSVCFCPTTERDLGDGIGPARALVDAGTPLALGSDQHAVIDLIEEARALEMHERLASQERGRFAPAQLLAAATNAAATGWPDAGTFAVGARADLVAVRADSVRTAGCEPGQILLAATAADVDTVIVDGRAVVEDARHRLGDVGQMLSNAIGPLWDAR